jgi:benzoyl-CoA reductase subunit C
MSVLQELTDLSRDTPGAAIQDWKESGKKVVGFFCCYVPEEILYAADILPVRMRAPGCAETSLADTYMSHLNCSFIRSCLQYALEGKYDFLDGLVFSSSCDHVRRLYDVLREVTPGEFPFLHLLSVPHKTDEDLVRWYAADLNDFRGKVEVFSEREISEERLRCAIGVYNETRSLLRQLYELRKSKNPPLTGSETLSVFLAGCSMPKAEFNALLRTLLVELQNKEGNSGYRARLMMAGSGGCDNPAYFEILEDLGGLIVTDSLCFGSRYFWEPVTLQEDLMFGLARSYLRRPSCPRMVNSTAERTDYVKRMVKDFDVDGVVFQRIRYCDLWGGQMLPMEKDLRDSRIPMLSLDREYSLSATGQLRTRVQAFLERLEGD